MIDQDIWALMDSGMLYDPADPALKDVQQSRLALLNEFNKLGGDPATREELQRRLFANVGRSVYIKPPFYANWAEMKVSIGNNVYINFLCCLVDDAPITIGNNVMIGPRVSICTATHPLDAEKRRKGLQYNKPVIIGDDVWIAANVFIGPGVTIGSGSVIGAGSTVLSDIPAGVLAYGTPAVAIRPVSPEERKGF